MSNQPDVAPSHGPPDSVGVYDGHTHASLDWFEPVEALLFQLDRNGIDRAAIVQFSGSLDNDYLLEARAAHPDRLSAVVGVDAQQPDAVDELARCAELGATGVRMAPTTRSPGRDPLALWRRAAEVGLTVSCYGSVEDHLAADFAGLLRELPELRVALEHLGDLRQAGRYLTVDRASELFTALAGRDGLWFKFHGLGELGPRATRITDVALADPSGAVLRRAYDILGPDRLMWGSGFPSVSSREGYTNSYALPRAVLRNQGMTDDEERRVFGANARLAFGPVTA